MDLGFISHMWDWLWTQKEIVWDERFRSFWNKILYRNVCIQYQKEVLT